MTDKRKSNQSPNRDSSGGPIPMTNTMDQWHRLWQELVGLVSVYCDPDETACLICNFHLNVAARKLVQAYCWAVKQATKQAKVPRLGRERERESE